MKQAEFMGVEAHRFDAELHPPRAQNRIQLDLPLFQQAAPVAESRAGRI